MGFFDRIWDQIFLDGIFNQIFNQDLDWIFNRDF